MEHNEVFFEGYLFEVKKGIFKPNSGDKTTSFPRVQRLCAYPAVPLKSGRKAMMEMITKDCG